MTKPANIYIWGAIGAIGGLLVTTIGRLTWAPGAMGGYSFKTTWINA